MRPDRATTSGIVIALSLWLGLITPVGAQDEAPPDPAATTLRITLDRMLGEHAFLSGEVIRTGILGGAEFTAATAMLDANTAEIVGAIEDIYGAEAADAFGQQWRNHIGYLVDYARALDAGDESAAALASDQLDTYVADFSALLASVIPSLPEGTVSGLIDEHVQQLEHISHFDASDYGEAYPALRETHAHMYVVGDGLALGIVERFPERFPGRSFAFSPATDLRVTLDRLIGEHSYLAALAMRAVVGGAADTDSVLAVLTANSDELAATLADVYGAEAGSAFGELWTSHIESYVAYAGALAASDTDAQQEALDALRDYRGTFTAFLAAANPFVSAPELDGLVAGHIDHLVAQADSYAEGDFAASYETARVAYAHANEMSVALARAIAAQFPDRLPTSALPPPTDSPARTVVAVLVLGASLAVVARLRLQQRRAM